MTYATLLATLASSLFVGPQIFLMSKTCLTSLTSTGPNYQPFNSTTETLHLGSECCKFTQGKTENQEETMDTENLDFDLEDQVSKRLGFENGTDSAIGYMMIRSKKWSQPGKQTTWNETLIIVYHNIDNMSFIIFIRFKLPFSNNLWSQPWISVHSWTAKIFPESKYGTTKTKDCSGCFYGQMLS